MPTSHQGSADEQQLLHQHASDARNTAAYLVEMLESLGIEYVFGVPGGAIEPFVDAMAVSARRGGLRFVVARHEAGAAFMAEAYARETGRLGVCCATSGPGATNLLTGVACAFESGVPILAVTGQPALPLFGRRALQESSCTGVDVVGMFKHCTRFNTLVSHVDQVQGKVSAAVLRALQQPQGPAHLSFPVDVLRSEIPASVAPATVAALTSPRNLIDLGATAGLALDLREARNPVFVIGRGCERAMPHLIELIEHYGAPFVVTPDAKGLISTHHTLYRGVLGFAGHQTALDTLQDDVDLIVTLGSRISEWTSAAWNKILLSDRLVHVDSTTDNFLHSPMAKRHVLGEIDEVARMLLEAALSDGEPSATPRVATQYTPERLDADPLPTGEEAMAGPIKPQHLMDELSRRLPSGTRIIADAGNSTAWAIHHLEEPGRVAGQLPRRNWLHVLMDFAPMGWAIGGAVGLARADDSSAVVCLTGDGSYLMNGQEITTAAQEGLPVIIVVLNDSALGMVKHGQRMAGAEQTAFELPVIDYALMARSMGVDAHVIETVQDFEDLDMTLLTRRPGPTLLDVRIDGEEPPPMSLRLKTLNQTQDAAA